MMKKLLLIIILISTGALAAPAYNFDYACGILSNKSDSFIDRDKGKLRTYVSGSNRPSNGDEIYLTIGDKNHKYLIDIKANLWSVYKSVYNFDDSVTGNYAQLIVSITAKNDSGEVIKKQRNSSYKASLDIDPRYSIRAIENPVYSHLPKSYRIIEMKVPIELMGDRHLIECEVNVHIDLD